MTKRPAPTARKIASLVALLSLVVAITSCGDDPDPVTDTSAATVTTSAPTTTGVAVVDTTSPVPQPEQPTTPTTEAFPNRDVLNYLEDMQGIAVRVGELVVDMRAANNDWDNRSESGVTYGDTEARLEDIERRSLALRDDIGLIEPPPDRGLPVEHQTAWLAVGQMADAAVDALAGLRSPDTGERRRAALAEFLVAYERFAGAFDRIAQIIGVGAGVSLPTTGTTVARPTTTTEATTTTTTGDATTTTAAGDTTTTTDDGTTTTTEGDTSGQSNVPPTPDVGYEVVEEGGSNVPGPARIWLTVQVDANATKAQLAQIGERLGFEYRLSKEYQALAIYFVHFPEGIDTLGNWIHAPHGDWERPAEEGDYSEHQIVDLTVEKDWTLLPTDDQMDLYRRYLEYKDQYAGTATEDELIADAAVEFEVEEDEIEAAIAAWEAWIAR